MKKKMNIDTLGTSLNRNEMKKIMAGSGSGNIYCSNGSNQVPCRSNQITPTLAICIELCVQAYVDRCHGCAQFP